MKMSLDVAGIKSEVVRPPQLFCHACFSVDRTLWPIGNLLEVFHSLCEYRGSQRAHVCWECLALLRRVSDFKRNACTVQTFLHHYQINQNTPLPQSLTRLSTTETKHEDFGPESERDAKGEGGREKTPESKVKNELPSAPLLLGFDLKEEIDEEKQCHAHGWQNEELDANTFVQTSLSTTDCQNDRKRTNTRKAPAKKYIKRTESDLRIREFYTKTPVDFATLESLLEKDRKDKVFVKYPHRCEKCVRGWKDKERLVIHNKKYHSKSSGPFRCDVCSTRAHSKACLARHVRAHFLARQCARCHFRCAARAHMRRHVLECHIKTVQCLACSACFHNVREFFDHHKSLHRQFVCDHCGKRYVSRASIKKHLANHGPFVCLQCDGQVFKTRDSLGAHRRLKHSELPRPELAYCVECDRQFDSVRAYRMHLADNDAHRKNARKRHFPCPTCGKVYVRNAYMRAHHKLVHLQRSDFCCRDCDASFVNRAQYVLHVKMKHEGYTRPKNKLCPVCGRGFTRNWYLRNHLRTHTGERPFTCGHCDASFGQRAAMKAHERHIHLKAK